MKEICVSKANSYFFIILDQVFQSSGIESQTKAAKKKQLLRRHSKIATGI